MRTWRDGIWTTDERRTVVAVLFILLGLLVYRYAARPGHMPPLLPDEGPRAHETISTLDPNVATWEQIALLPGMGEKRARAVVEYREQYLADYPGNGRAFETIDDLMNISGFGEATVENLAPYLSIYSEPEH